MEAHVAEKPEDALGEAKLIVTATTSENPVLSSEVGEDIFIAAVEAFKPGMAEISPELIRASNVVVDTLDGARSEAEDLIQAHAAGALGWDEVLELQEFLDLDTMNPPISRPTIFKSVGGALWDLASARGAFG